MKLAKWQNILWRLIKKIFTAYHHFGHIFVLKFHKILINGLLVKPTHLNQKIRDSRTPFLNSLSQYGQDISEIESQFENYIFEKSASKNEDSNQKLTDLGRKKRSNRSSNRVDEENSSPLTNKGFQDFYSHDLLCN